MNSTLKDRLVSVYTPTCNTGQLLLKAYESLKQQTYDKWEWVICDDGSNNETVTLLKQLEKQDKRIRIFFFENSGLIGKLKKLCTEACKGDYLVELDHDDQLTNNCLEEVLNCFDKNPETGMVYSNFTEVDEQGNCHMYNASYWQYRDTFYEGKTYKEALAPDIYSKVDELVDNNIMHWSLMPNHVRAFRKKELIRLGGYDDSLIYADDYDLILRFYLYSKITHIPKLLYLYRWGDNTWLKNNQDLQQKMLLVRDRYFPQLRIELGCGRNKTFGFKGIDAIPYEGVDYVIDFAQDGLMQFKESSIDEMRAIDFIEHIEDKVFTLEQIYRALKPNGIIFIQVPSTDGRGAFQDPTHKSYWNQNSFLDGYMNGEYRYGANYNFKVESVLTTETNEIGVCWVQVLLRAIKSL